jgi:hypothetical protein
MRNSCDFFVFAAVQSSCRKQRSTTRGMGNATISAAIKREARVVIARERRREG